MALFLQSSDLFGVQELVLDAHPLGVVVPVVVVGDLHGHVPGGRLALNEVTDLLRQRYEVPGEEINKL